MLEINEMKPSLSICRFEGSKSDGFVRVIWWLACSRDILVDFFT